MPPGPHPPAPVVKPGGRGCFLLFRAAPHSSGETSRRQPGPGAGPDARSLLARAFCQPGCVSYVSPLSLLLRRFWRLCGALPFFTHGMGSHAPERRPGQLPRPRRRQRRWAVWRCPEKGGKGEPKERPPAGGASRRKPPPPSPLLRGMEMLENPKGGFPTFPHPSATPFMVAILSSLQARYSYGRGVTVDRYSNEVIHLPVDNNGQPDYDFMEQYIGERARL